MNVIFAGTRIAVRWCYEKSIQNLQGKTIVILTFLLPCGNPGPMHLKTKFDKKIKAAGPGHGFVQFVQLRNVKNFSITSLALCGVLVATISITPANLILDKEGSKSSLQLHIIVSTKKGEF